MFRRGIRAAALFILINSTPLMFPSAAGAKDLFPGYPVAVRAQAEKVLAVAGPGKEDDLKKEVRTLRIRMHGMGILSMNALPDLLFQRALREGWKGAATPVLRIVSEISPFSVPMWAWLVKEDVLSGRVSDLIQDIGGLAGALRRFSPAQLGYASWFLSFLSAAACWFILWGSAALFLRARPSLEGDIQRLLKIHGRDYLAPVMVALVFLLPIMAGLGLAVVSSIWLLFSVAYLRRGELVVMTAVVLVLVCMLPGGGILHSLNIFAAENVGGWSGGEGTISPGKGKETSTGRKGYPAIPENWMQRFATARQEMQSGEVEAAEKRWTLLLEEGREIPEVLNNRGIVRAQQGSMKEALADFESAAGKSPEDPSALWNAYLLHLQMLNLDRVQQIQPEAWTRIRKMYPFQFRPDDMEQGEWIASPMPSREIWSAVFRLREDWIRDAGESDFFLTFFRPLTAPGVVAFLAVVWLSSGAWNLLSRKLWIHSTCRSCGGRALVVRSREVSDICAACRAKIGGGTRLGHERTRRIQGVVGHRRFVMAASLAVPGVGALWSGKVIRTLLYGIVLSLSLAAVSCSLGGGRVGGPIIAELQRIVLWLAIALTALFWAGGTAWGIRSFTILQRNQNVAGGRV